MSLKKTTTHGGHTLTELNITPLLDLVFVLLVIFIITTPQMMNNLEMALPSGKPPPKQDKDKPKVNKISVTADGQAYLNDTPVTVAELKTQLQAMKAANPEMGVVIKGDDDVNYQNMVSVLDVLQQLEITKVGLATQTQ